MVDYKFSAFGYTPDSYHTCTPHVGGEGQPTPPIGEAGEGVKVFGK